MVVLALAAVREGDMLVAPKLDRLARVRPRCPRHRRPASGTRRETDPRPDALRPRAIRWESCFSISSPPSPSSKPILSACTPARASPSPAPGGNCTASSGNSAACMPRASIPSAISPISSQSQDQPPTAHSTGAISLGVRSCPYRNRPEIRHFRSPIPDSFSPGVSGITMPFPPPLHKAQVSAIPPVIVVDSQAKTAPEFTSGGQKTGSANRDFVVWSTGVAG